MISPAVRPARPADVPAIEELLIEASLPVDGLRDHLPTILVAEDAGSVIGAIALEIYGLTALVRSAVVAPSLQNRGVGSLMYTALLDLAHQRDVKRLVLLTTTAEQFFQQRGFRRVDRSTLPGPILQSVEFTSACPASAVCMELLL